MSHSTRGVVSILAILLWLPVGALAQKQSKVPRVAWIEPTSTYAPGSSFTLSVFGVGFTNGSVVQWNGGSRPTTVVGSTQLQAQISSADVATGGTAAVTVFTPGRFGGTSASISFTINPAPAAALAPPPPPPPAPGPLTITTTSVPAAKAGTAYNSALAASGGTPAYTWSIPSGGGAMPPGLALTAAGDITGTPTTAGTASLTAQATDTAGQVAQKAFSLEVDAAPLPPGGTALLFQDGFESKDLSAWGSNTGTDGGCSAVPENYIRSTTTLPHSGSYSSEAHIYIDDTGICAQHHGSGVYMSKYFSPGLDHVFIRGYVRFHVNADKGGTPVYGVGRKLFYFFDSDSDNWHSVFATAIGESESQYRAFTLGLGNKGGDQCDGGTITPVTGAPCGTWARKTTHAYTWDFDAWYYVEVEEKLNTPSATGPYDGEARAWVQKVGVDPSPILIIEITGANFRTEQTAGMGLVRVGEQADRQNWQKVDEQRYWDDIAISTTGPIGPLPE